MVLGFTGRGCHLFILPIHPPYSSFLFILPIHPSYPSFPFILSIHPSYSYSRASSRNRNGGLTSSRAKGRAQPRGPTAWRAAAGAVGVGGATMTGYVGWVGGVGGRKWVVGVEDGWFRGRRAERRQMMYCNWAFKRASWPVCGWVVPCAGPCRLVGVRGPNDLRGRAEQTMLG